MKKPVLILQLRPEDAASDNEYEAFLDKGGLEARETERIRLEQMPPLEGLDLDRYAGVIVGGGPGCISDSNEDKSDIDRYVETSLSSLMTDIIERDRPFLGCCYGIGMLAHHLGAEVSKERYSEPIGPVECRLTEDGLDDPLLADLPDRFQAFVGHKEAVQHLPEGAVHLVASPTCPMQMIRVGRNVYATQFHPEADSDVFALRCRVYANEGYFPAEEMDRMIAMCEAAEVTEPEHILARFVQRCRAMSS